MVIPVTKKITSSQKELKRYIGNNLNIHLTENKKSLYITGSNITVKIDENQGNLKIVGDNCRVDVTGGMGKIYYVGNNGKFNFGSSEMSEHLQYSGNNISVTAGNKSIEIKEKVDGAKEVVDGISGNKMKPAIHIANTNHVRINSSGTVFRSVISKK